MCKRKKSVISEVSHLDRNLLGFADTASLAQAGFTLFLPLEH